MGFARNLKPPCGWAMEYGVTRYYLRVEITPGKHDKRDSYPFQDNMERRVVHNSSMPRRASSVVDSFVTLRCLVQSALFRSEDSHSSRRIISFQETVRL